MTIKISTLGHVVLRTPDLHRARAFYAGLLGLQEVAAEEFDGQQWAFFSTGNSHHELALVEDPSADRSGSLHHVGFKVGDSVEQLLRARAELDAAGAPLLATLDFRVSQAVIVTDPDGNTVELFVDTPGEPWRRDPSMVAFAAPLEI